MATTLKLFEQNTNETLIAGEYNVSDEKPVTKEIPKYILVTEWENYFTYPTEGALRALIFNKEKNGFHKVIRRIPRIMICVDAYYEWIEEINRLDKKI